MDVPVTLVSPDGRDYTAHTQNEAVRLVARGYRPKTEAASVAAEPAAETAAEPDNGGWDNGGWLAPGVTLARAYSDEAEPVDRPEDESHDSDES